MVQLNTAVKMKDGCRYIPITSKRFICPKCNIFCIEWTPVWDAAARRLTARGEEPVVKIACKNNCHDRPGWGWKSFDWRKISERNRICDWPSKKQWEGKK